jgi:hypothetical protein
MMCIIVSVAVDFWYMPYNRLFSILYIMMPRKFILFCSFSTVNCNFGWMLLNFLFT